MTNKERIKSALESMMFVWGEPLDVKTAADVVDMPWKEVYDLFMELQDEYEAYERGLRIRRVDKSFQIVTYSENYEYIRKLCTPVKKRKLTQSALEVLAIIAYRQPVTRGEIESVRGIKCERVIDGLVQKGLVKEAGRSNSLGRPILYATTDEFLRYMDIESIADLPQLEDGDREIYDYEEEGSLEIHQISMDSLSNENNDNNENKEE
ncbi:MAG TPA: SMC-Scp complex subunit ScpB [Candidatus Eubacterium pullicola]|nr:SMC-Scp complex subunit ScpB [Candidatus Eubacterium pullicola]